MRKIAASLAFACWAVGFAGGGARSGASPVVWDFEDQTATGFKAGALTALQLVHPSLEAVVTRPGDPSRFDVYDVNEIGNPSFPAGWGIRSLNPWFSNSGTAFVATFSRPIRSFALQMGDFGGDPDDLSLEAFAGPDATGASLTAVAWQLPQGGSSFTSAELRVSDPAASIRSVRFMGGSAAYATPFGVFSVPNSVYYDNFTATVPEPGGAVLTAVAAWGLAAGTRRRR